MANISDKTARELRVIVQSAIEGYPHFSRPMPEHLQIHYEWSTVFDKCLDSLERAFYVVQNEPDAAQRKVAVIDTVMEIFDRVLAPELAHIVNHPWIFHKMILPHVRKSLLELVGKLYDRFVSVMLRTMASLPKSPD